MITYPLNFCAGLAGYYWCILVFFPAHDLTAAAPAECGLVWCPKTNSFEDGKSHSQKNVVSCCQPTISSVDMGSVPFSNWMGSSNQSRTRRAGKQYKKIPLTVVGLTMCQELIHSVHQVCRMKIIPTWPTLAWHRDLEVFWERRPAPLISCYHFETNRQTVDHPTVFVKWTCLIMLRFVSGRKTICLDCYMLMGFIFHPQASAALGRLRGKVFILECDSFGLFTMVVTNLNILLSMNLCTIRNRFSNEIPNQSHWGIVLCQDGTWVSQVAFDADGSSNEDKAIRAGLFWHGKHGTGCSQVWFDTKNFSVCMSRFWYWNSCMMTGIDTD